MFLQFHLVSGLSPVVPRPRPPSTTAKYSRHAETAAECRKNKHVLRKAYLFISRSVVTPIPTRR